jgi:DNA gyrase subunit B
VIHVALEVLAYVADEAAAGHAGRCLVTLCADGSLSIADDGRGTETCLDAAGRVVKKPVLSSKDQRFFDAPTAQALPDGYPRRGMSVVAALSRWLVHVNRRERAAWRQRYEQGVPVTDLVSIAGDGTTGTTIHFLPDSRLPGRWCDPQEIGRLASAWDHPDVEIRDQRGEAWRVDPPNERQ